MVRRRRVREVSRGFPTRRSSASPRRFCEELRLADDTAKPSPSSVSAISHPLRDRVIITACERDPRTMIDWRAYVAYVAACGRDIEHLRTRLALLDVGHTGTCSPATNFVWMDTTEREKGLVRRAIARKMIAMMNVDVCSLSNSSPSLGSGAPKDGAIVCPAREGRWLDHRQGESRSAR